jgi:hypothetical protein
MSAQDFVLRPLHSLLDRPFHPGIYLAGASIVPLTAFALLPAIVLDTFNPNAASRPGFFGVPIKAACYSLTLIAFFVARVAACFFLYNGSPLGLAATLASFFFWPIDVTLASLLCDSNEGGVFTQVVYEGGRLPQKLHSLFNTDEAAFVYNPLYDFDNAVAAIKPYKMELLAHDRFSKVAAELFNMNTVTAQGVLNLVEGDDNKAKYMRFSKLYHPDRFSEDKRLAEALFTLFKSAYECTIRPPESRSCLAGLLPI